MVSVKNIGEPPSDINHLTAKVNGTSERKSEPVFTLVITGRRI
jgi:hypothetical protein